MTTMKVSVTNAPAIRTAITFIADFIDEYAWHKPTCVAENLDRYGAVTAAAAACDCGYNDALNTLNTLRITHTNAPR